MSSAATAPITTREAARQLGVQYYRLHYLCTTGKMSSPRKNVSGNYEWSPEDIERARVALGGSGSACGVR